MAQVLSFKTGRKMISSSVKQPNNPQEKTKRLPRTRGIRVGYVVDLPPEYQYDTVKTINSTGWIARQPSLKYAISELGGFSIERMRQDLILRGCMPVGRYSAKTVDQCIDSFIADDLKYIFLYAEYGWWLWRMDGELLVKTRLIHRIEDLDAWYDEIGRWWYEKKV